MRIVTFVAAAWWVAALPALAAPPSASPPKQSHTQAPASHNRIGEIMGSLTHALQEAAEQRQAQPHQPTDAQVDQPDTAVNGQTTATSLPPDANAQAAVP